MRTYIKTGQWGLAFFMAGVIWISIAAMQPVHAAYYALVAGVNTHPSTFVAPSNWLTSCVNDAAGIRGKMLTDTNRWKSNRIQMLLNSAATETAIRARLHARAATLRAGDVFVYYHSSHGTRQAVGSRNAALFCFSSLFWDWELGQDLARFPSGVKVFVILDACYSAGMFKSGQPEDWNFVDNVMAAYREAAVAAGDTSKSLGGNVAFMTASEYTQTSLALPSISDYTKYLIRCCTRPIEDKDPRDGKFSFWELHSYAKRGVIAEDGGVQIPQHWNYTQLRLYPFILVKIAAPTPIGPTGSTIARPFFSWNTVDGAKYYRLQIFSSAGRLVRDYNYINALGGRPDVNLPNGNYSWRVCGYNHGNFQGGWSQKLSFAVNPSGAFIRRATLTWGYAPRDLDSWLVTPTGARIGYSNKGSQSYAPRAQLDVDDTSRYGPENISIYQFTPSAGRVYKYYVHQYSNDNSSERLSGCGARVSVQGQTGIIKTFVCPYGSGRYWHVFNMSAAGTIIPVNRIVASPP